MVNSNSVEGANRVKFGLKRRGLLVHDIDWSGLSKSLKILGEVGCAPVGGDGGRAGNVALRTKGGLIVSRSNRSNLVLKREDFVEIVGFSRAKWEVCYLSMREDIIPTSDTPLYWLALVEMSRKMRWSHCPQVAIHGHALEMEEAAAKLGIPISRKETEFSTPEDYEAFSELLSSHPYPEHKIFIRKGHGFFILGESIEEINDLTLRTISEGRRLQIL